ncbi:unnamed protein product [Pieris macdunnoughi]|uniref:Uncharacterized protein n=1 Tax=Pieris macdunnoughi TaxID=345717 RepID=A0A821XKC9_9NEOP|nr:unnamed protein product [Pieris macdunnoughi]
MSGGVKSGGKGPRSVLDLALVSRRWYWARRLVVKPRHVRPLLTWGKPSETTSGRSRGVCPGVESSVVSTCGEYLTGGDLEAWSAKMRFFGYYMGRLRGVRSRFASCAMNSSMHSIRRSRAGGPQLRAVRCLVLRSFWRLHS